MGGFCVKWRYSSSSSEQRCGDGGAVQRGSAGGWEDCDGDDLQVRRVLQEGDDVSLLALVRTKADLQGRVGIEAEEAGRAVWVLCARGV